MANYLVTGGCGFIGSHLCDALIGQGHGARVLDDLSAGKPDNLPAGATLVVGDIRDRGIVAAAAEGVDGIFHLAAIPSVARSLDDWSGTHQVNLTGTINILEAARSSHHGRPPRVVYASSAAVYGDNEAVPLDESATPLPLTPYGADKLGCEINARLAWSIFKVPNVGLRFFNVYGPRQDPRSPYSGVISRFAERTLSGRPLEVFGDGRQTRDFIFVADVVRFLIAAMADDSASAEVLNVCTGEPTTILTLANAIGECSGRRPAIRHLPPRAGDIRASIGDPGAATRRLSVTARTPLRDGLAQTVASLAPVPA